MEDVLTELYEVVTQRHENPQEGSYTCYLFDQGLDKILKKVGEESAETIIVKASSKIREPQKISSGGQKYLKVAVWRPQTEFYRFADAFLLFTCFYCRIMIKYFIKAF